MTSRAAQSFIILFALLTAASLWLALDHFRDSQSLRITQANLASSHLKIDTEKEPDTFLTLTFALSLDFTSPGRNFQWDGDAGNAVCPEKSLNAFADWKVGGFYPSSTIRGNSREVRFNSLEDNPEFDRGIAWSILALMLLVITIPIYVFTRLDDTLTKGISGVGLIFVGFGLMPLIGGMALGYGNIRDQLAFVPVSIGKTTATPLDLSQLSPAVEVTPSARTLLADNIYAVYQYQRAGRTGRVCGGPTSGVFSAFRGERTTELPRYVGSIDPRNRGNVRSELSFAVPVCSSAVLSAKPSSTSPAAPDYIIGRTRSPSMAFCGVSGVDPSISSKISTPSAVIA